MAGRLLKDTTVCLSDLPNEILIHILSFLPSKSAVSTSVLSRRWRYLWTSTPNLQLHEYEFKKRRVFMLFAERALLLHTGSSLVFFSLSCSVRKDGSRISTWITSAIQRNVEQLTLNLYGSFFLPYCVFGCQSLVKLVLYMRSIRVPSVICLPRLKHLSLKWVELEDNESAEKLLSHPLLEELILVCCTWDNITTVNVNSPKLQSLEIIDRRDRDWSEEQQVCFFGDNLKIFRYEGLHSPTLYSICGSTMQLREAIILVEYHGEDVHYTHGASNRYCKLLNSLSEVQSLTLSQVTAQRLYVLSQCQWLQTTLPVFGRLTQLNLESGYDRRAISIDSECLTMLYKRCPHLEHLNLMYRISLDFPAEPILRPMPSCFHTHLKKITLQICELDLVYSSCYEDAINVLFNSAPVLEEMVILFLCVERYVSRLVSRVEELERELNARPKNCRVSVSVVKTKKVM